MKPKLQLNIASDFLINANRDPRRKDILATAKREAQLLGIAKEHALS